MPAIAPIGVTPFVPPTISTSPTAAPVDTGAFGRMLRSAGALETQADTLAAGVATGAVNNVHEFTTAAAKAGLAVQLTAALRNRAVEAYQEIMRMQV